MVSIHSLSNKRKKLITGNKVTYNYKVSIHFLSNKRKKPDGAYGTPRTGNVSIHFLSNKRKKPPRTLLKTTSRERFNPLPLKQEEET
ncbi:hypothetical protein [Leptospira noguchii]|uniref:hypothetical protein n=1 Tax=Leptospira noguchii TaxID=28182 RepID=UPI003B3B458C